jgi:hypothetical protein
MKRKFPFSMSYLPPTLSVSSRPLEKKAWFKVSRYNPKHKKGIDLDSAQQAHISVSPRATIL